MDPTYATCPGCKEHIIITAYIMAMQSPFRKGVLRFLRVLVQSITGLEAFWPLVHHILVMPTAMDSEVITLMGICKGR